MRPRRSVYPPHQNLYLYTTLLYHVFGNSSNSSIRKDFSCLFRQFAFLVISYVTILLFIYFRTGTMHHPQLSIPTFIIFKNQSNEESFPPRTLVISAFPHTAFFAPLILFFSALYIKHYLVFSRLPEVLFFFWRSYFL